MAKEKDETTTTTMPSLASSSTWRDTLYVWDGILTIDMEVMNRKKAESKEVDEIDDIPVKWDGTWIGPENCKDASTVEAPKRGVFDAFVESDMKFSLEGVAKRVKTGETEAKFKPYQVNMVNGEGWDLRGDASESDNENGGDTTGPKNLKKIKHRDAKNEIYLTNLRWSGDLRDKRNNLIFAIGNNANGKFISTGWMRPGNRLTLARRYIKDDDSRFKWNINDLRKAVLDEIFDEQEMTVKIPPWQCLTMHSNDKEAEKEEMLQQKNKKQKVDHDNNNGSSKEEGEKQ